MAWTRDFSTEFDWTGTRDPSAYLATDVAIDFHARLGGEAMMARNIALAAEATSLLARRLNTEVGAVGALAGSMGMIRLPLTGEATAELSMEIRARLLEARNRRANARAGQRRLAAHLRRRLQ